MITYKINGKKYSFPTCWEDVTYSQYVALIRTHSLTDHIAVFSGIPRETLENAEMVKLAGMRYRDVNIALMNELSRYVEAAGLDLSHLIDASNTDGEAQLMQPGIVLAGSLQVYLVSDNKRLLTM